jgi:phospholipid transport system substrate-binding protein
MLAAMKNLRRWLLQGLWLMGLAAQAAAAVPDPSDYVRQLGASLLSEVRADPQVAAGDNRRVLALVDAKLLPHVDFARMTAEAVGRPWREATPAQRQALQQAFKTLLVRTYAGAIARASDMQWVVFPTRDRSATDVVVRSELRPTKGETLTLAYRLSWEEGSGWKIYDLNVLGIWLVEVYRGQFARPLADGGVAALVNALEQLNQRAQSAR